jgi:3-phenylpropionate/trans-cinnamate dioxygenase ferredoxin subunit
MAEFLKAMQLEEIPDDGGACVLLAGQKIALFRVGGEVYAIDDTCSHEEASLSAGMLYLDDQEPQIECPKHGSMFSIVTGQVFSLPAVRPVHSFETDIRDGVVYVSVVPRPLASSRH